MDDTTIAYVAGLFDGEGCIGIWRSKGPIYKWSKSPVYRLTIAIASTHKDVIYWLADLFEGTRYRRQKAAINNPKWANSWTWCATNTRALNILVALKPYLRLKSAEAQIAIDFYANCINNRRSGGANGNPALTEEELQLRDSYVLAMHNAKSSYKDYSLG